MENSFAKNKIILGVAPTKRAFLSIDEAKAQKAAFMAVISAIKSDKVEIVNIDDVCENGIMDSASNVDCVVEKFSQKKIDALFIPHCDFGTEEATAGIAVKLGVPVLIWGARDERTNSFSQRGRDTQCGMFAATKVLMRYGVRYSYIYNCETESQQFKNGYTNFLRVVSVLKTLKTLRVAKFGARPASFLSVTANEGQLMSQLGITTVPITVQSVSDLADEIAKNNSADFTNYLLDLQNRIDCSAMPSDKLIRLAAIKFALKESMDKNQCTVGAIECWPAGKIWDVEVCGALGELADEGYMISCETDVNGAVTMAMLHACSLFDDAVFLADLTVRNPERDNSELLWHCGPFAYSLKSQQSTAKLVENGKGSFYLKNGAITIARLDDINGQFYLFAGEGTGATGPETTGTYVYFETDDWQRFEEKLIFGPYIHHVGGVYGNYFTVLKEVARYLNLEFDSVHKDGPSSL